MNKPLFLISFVTLSLITKASIFAQSGGFDYRTEVKEIYSTNLNETHKLNVYLPEGYAGSDQKYPVLYVLESIYHFLNGVKSVHSLSYLSGQIPNMIVVGLNTKDRWMDLTPIKTEDWYGYPLPNSGNGKNYLNYIAQEVAPFIDSTYRTQPFRIVYGHSLGGLFTLYSLTEYPELFDGYIASSPNLTYGDTIVTKSAVELKKTQLKTHKFIYFCGDNDAEGYTEEIKTFREVIDKHAKIESFYKDYKDENHLSTPNKSMPDGLRYIFKDYSLNDSIIKGGGQLSKPILKEPPNYMVIA